MTKISTSFIVNNRLKDSTTCIYATFMWRSWRNRLSPNFSYIIPKHGGLYRDLHDLSYLFRSGTKEMDGQGGQLPTQVLGDQLTLYQSEGADCAPHIKNCPPMFTNNLSLYDGVIIKMTFLPIS